jgi:hypothetical protein
MATGRLGTNAPGTINTYTSVYQVPAGYYSVFNVSFTNTTAAAVTIRLALSTSATTPNANEVLEYDTTIVPKGVFERTGLVAQAGLYVLGYVSATGVNVNVYGIETSTA